MKGTFTVRALLVLALLAMVMGSVWAQGGGGGGGGGRGGGGAMRQMQYLEQAWCALGFELGATTDQYMKLFPIFKAQWDLRKDAIAKARAANDFQSLGPVMQQVKATLDQALKDTLTAEQAQKWEELKAAQQQQMGGRGGGGQAGGPPPPGN